MEEEHQETTQWMEFSEVKGIIRRHRWDFLAPFFLGWLLVWGVSWALPSIYRSGTLILVEQPAVPEKFVVSNIDTDIQHQMDSITQQILSRTRLLRIIDHLHLYAQDRGRVGDDVLVERMQKDIEIELVHGDDRKLSAFNIYYLNRDPKMAQKGTAELANLFITENLEQRQERSESTTKFLEEQLEQARQKLAEQEARVRQFKDKHVGELPTQTQSNMQILSGLQTELQSKEDALNRAKQQNTYLESLISQYRAMDRKGSKSSEAGPDQLAAIDKELDRLKAQLADLSSHYTDKHPDVRKTKEQIARTEKMRARVLADMNSGTGEESPGSASGVETKTPMLLELESQLQANRAEIANHQTEIRDLHAKVGGYQGRLNLAPVMEQQFADITRDYEQSKTNYDSLLAKKNQSEMSTNLEKTQQGEHFRMLDPPNLPAKPYQPNRLKMSGMGLMLGLVLGAGAAFGREKINGKVYTEKEIKNLLPFEVMSEIPVIETPAEQLAHQRSSWMAAATAVVILGVILLGSAITYWSS